MLLSFFRDSIPEPSQPSASYNTISNDYATHLNTLNLCQLYNKREFFPSRPVVFRIMTSSESNNCSLGEKGVAYQQRPFWL